MNKNRLCMLLLASFFMVAVTPVPYMAQGAIAATKQSATQKKTTAQKTSKKPAKKTASKSKATPAPDRFAALVVNADTGQILYEKNAGSPRYPASLTKMMTLYLTFDALKKGTLKMDQEMLVSKKAATMPQTNISLNAGDKLTVRKAIESLVIRSANDASMVLAETLGKTQWNFALMMTNKARQLGMKDTVFRNPNGLPDNQQHTTAYDMARLGIALRRDFPEYYHFFSLREFSHNGINYTTHNRVMDRYKGADGIKTGYIRASGFNLVTSVRRNGYNLVAVIMGGESSAGRDDQMIAMLDRTFAQLGQKSVGVANHNHEDNENKISGLIAPIRNAMGQAAMAAGVH